MKKPQDYAVENLEKSDKLANFLDKVRSEAGREIVIREVSDVGLSGMSAAFRPHPHHILIVVIPNKLPPSELERSIAHEAAHGLLFYGRNYCQLCINNVASDQDTRTLNLLNTMVGDIVVNKVIEEEGFYPFGIIYLSEVEKETKAARKDRDHYKMFSDDPPFREKFIVFRIVTAWTFLEFFDLRPYEKRTLRKFLKALQKTYPHEYSEANQIKSIILRSGIFTPHGYQKALEDVLSLWDLGNMVTLRTANSLRLSDSSTTVLNLSPKYQ